MVANERELGKITSDIEYLKSCCEDFGKDMKDIRNEQLSAKNRTNATLVGVIVSLIIMAVNYFK